jgi:hypothetical protein
MHSDGVASQIILDREIPFIFNGHELESEAPAENDVVEKIKKVKTLTALNVFTLSVAGSLDGIDTPDRITVDLDTQAQSIFEFSYQMSGGERHFQAKIRIRKDQGRLFDWTILKDPDTMPHEKAIVLSAVSDLLDSIIESYQTRKVVQQSNGSNGHEPAFPEPRRTHSKEARPKKNSYVADLSKDMKNVLNRLPVVERDAIIEELRNFNGSGLPRLDIPGLKGGPYYRIGHNGVSLALSKSGDTYKVVAAGTIREIIKRLTR